MSISSAALNASAMRLQAASMIQGAKLQTLNAVLLIANDDTIEVARVEAVAAFEAWLDVLISNQDLNLRAMREGITNPPHEDS